MSKEDLWTRAATEMRADSDPRWHAVADWLHSEALVRDEVEPFVELINAAFEQQSGIKGYLRFGRRADGEIALVADTDEGATAVALAYLDETTTPAPTPAHPSEEADRG